jgi:hypothetical protein
LVIGPVAHAGEYVVERATDEAFSQPVRLHEGPLTGTAAGAVVTAVELSPDTPYFFRVTARAAGYASGPARVCLTTTGTVHDMGDGVGGLHVDGQEVRAGDIIRLRPGNYRSFLISNLRGSPEKRIHIVPAGPVIIDGGGGNGVLLTAASTPGNLNHVTIDGRIDPSSLVRSLSFKNSGYRGIDISGDLAPQFFEISWCDFRDINDHTMIWSGSIAYNGASSAFNGFSFTHNVLTSCGSISLGGALTRSINRGLVKDAWFAHNTFQDRPALGSALILAHSDNYNIHGNIVDRVNTDPTPGSVANNHNGIFLLRGWGRFHGNRVTNHQGNAVRAWTYALGAARPILGIYNNIVCQSRRYSAFEIQEFAENLVDGVSVAPDAQVHSNTGINLNTHTPTVYTGVILDLYNFSGATEVFNNVLANGRSQAGVGVEGVCSVQGSGGHRLHAHHNRVFETHLQAGIASLTDFKLLPDSPLRADGVPAPELKTDIFGRARPEVPSVGAVEYHD